MHPTLQTSFKKWDQKHNDPEVAYIELNNLFLRVERGEETLTITSANKLRVLVTQAFPARDDFMREWWEGELQKLPNWTEV